MEVYKVTARVTSEPPYHGGETIVPWRIDNFGVEPDALCWEVSIRIKAESHIQHVWSETSLVGVSHQGMRRLKVFSARYGADNLTVEVGRRAVKLVSWE